MTSERKAEIKQQCANVAGCFADEFDGQNIMATLREMESVGGIVIWWGFMPELNETEVF